MMALVGKRNGVGIVFGRKIQGFIGWIFWKVILFRKSTNYRKKI
jgi:NADH dehydrogenase FAD-containing subunit